MKTINIKDYCDQEEKRHQLQLYIGNTYGERVRERSGIDKLCETEDCIVVEFPENTMGVSSGFLEGLFENVALTYGVDGLRKKVRIETNGYDINEQLHTVYSRFAQKEQIQAEKEHDKERSKKSDAVMLRLANVFIAVLAVPISILLCCVMPVTALLFALPYWVATGNDPKWWMVPAFQFWEWLEQQIDYQRFN